MQTWLNRVVCLRCDYLAAPPMECLLPCCSVASFQPRKSTECAKEARVSGKERGRLVRMGAPTFLSASRMRSSSSVSSISFILPFAPIKADVAACLCRGRQVRAPVASLYCSAFFRVIGAFGGQPSFRQNNRKVLAKGKTGIRFE